MDQLEALEKRPHSEGRTNKMRKAGEGQGKRRRGGEEEAEGKGREEQVKAPRPKAAN